MQHHSRSKMPLLARALRSLPRAALQSQSRGFARTAAARNDAPVKLSSPLDADWANLVKKELKGKDAMGLVWRTAEVCMRRGQPGNDAERRGTGRSRDAVTCHERRHRGGPGSSGLFALKDEQGNCLFARHRAIPAIRAAFARETLDAGPFNCYASRTFFLAGSKKGDIFITLLRILRACSWIA